MSLIEFYEYIIDYIEEKHPEIIKEIEEKLKKEKINEKRFRKM